MKQSPLTIVVGTVLATTLVAVPAHAQRRRRRPAPAPAPAATAAPAADDNSGGGTMDFTQGAGGQPAQSSTPPPPCKESKILQQGVKLYEAKDYYNSSIQFDKILNGGADNCVADQQKAQFFMGETLFHLKYFAEALSYFAKIADTGQGHLFYKKALPWLAALSEKLPDSSGVLDKIGSYSEAELETPELAAMRDQLYFLTGRYDFQTGKVDDAIRLFDLIPENSDYFIKAKFFEGDTYVRMAASIPPPAPGDDAAAGAAAKQSTEDFTNAANQFKEILRKTYPIEPDKKTPDQIEYEELANLQLARTFYSVGQYDKGIKYFDKIPQESPDWLESLFEESWAMFMQHTHSHALGNIQTLNAPYFDTEFFPESLVLKSVIYFENCRFDGSGSAITEFRSTYLPIQKELKAALEKYTDPADLFDFTVKVLAGKGGLSDRSTRAAVSVLSDREIKKNYAFVDELDKESAAINRSPADWKSTQVSGNILGDLEVQESLAKAKAGQLAHDRLQTLVDQIRDLQNQTTRVEIETLEAQKGNIPNDLKADMTGGAVRNENVVDDEHNYWPFDGEYWKDELGYYRYHIENKCPKQARQ